VSPPPEPLPEDFALWRKSTCTLHGRTVCVARRNGVTLQLIHDKERGWAITKIHKGRILAERVLKNIPSDIRHAVFAANHAGPRR
jgi:hypothetical protein